MLAKGSRNAPDTFIAGERGPELITNGKGRTVFTALQTERIMTNAGAAQQGAQQVIITLAPALIAALSAAPAVNTVHSAAIVPQMQAAELEVRETVSSAEQVQKEYTQLMNWAELYDNCSLEAKKMIVAQFVKAVRVKRGYELDIEFNVSFEEFQALYLEPEEKGRKRKRAGEILALAECAG